MGYLNNELHLRLLIHLSNFMKLRQKSALGAHFGMKRIGVKTTIDVHSTRSEASVCCCESLFFMLNIV